MTKLADIERPTLTMPVTGRGSDLRPFLQGLHPFIQGLIEVLPEPGTQWGAKDREKWLNAAAHIFDLIYEGEDARKSDDFDFICEGEDAGKSDDSAAQDDSAAIANLQEQIDEEAE